MSQMIKQYLKDQRRLLTALAITGLAIFTTPNNSEAAVVGTTADTKVVNVVHVTYKDAGNTQSFEATATTTVTVNLVKAPLVASAPPSDTDANIGFTCPAPYSVDSGSSVSYLYALTAAANGDDDYKFAMPTPTFANVVDPPTVHWYILDGVGAVESTDPANRILGAATPIDVKDATTLYFPGGALAGFESGDIVVVNQKVFGKRAYLVDGDPVVGSAATHSVGTKLNSDPATWTDGAEVKGELKLKAFPTATALDIALVGGSVTYGGTATPDFALTSGINAPVVGEPVGEMVLVKVTTTATVNNTSALDGTVTYTLNTTDSAGNNPTALPGVACPAGNFQGVGLTITKEARNVSVIPADNTFGAGKTGNPGQILEYRITVQNTKGKATAVRVTDAVPVYTTLVAGSAYGTVGSAAATDIFAKADKNGGTAVNLTVQSTDTESAAVVSGNGTTGSIAAGQTLTFYVGTGNDLDSGGVVDNASDAIYHIYYQVKID